MATDSKGHWETSHSGALAVAMNTEDIVQVRRRQWTWRSYGMANHMKGSWDVKQRALVLAMTGLIDSSAQQLTR